MTFQEALTKIGGGKYFVAAYCLIGDERSNNRHGVYVEQSKRLNTTGVVFIDGVEFKRLYDTYDDVYVDDEAVV